MTKGKLNLYAYEYQGKFLKFQQNTSLNLKAIRT